MPLSRQATISEPTSAEQAHVRIWNANEARYSNDCLRKSDGSLLRGQTLKAIREQWIWHQRRSKSHAMDLNGAISARIPGELAAIRPNGYRMRVSFTRATHSARAGRAHPAGRTRHQTLRIVDVGAPHGHLLKHHVIRERYAGRCSCRNRAENAPNREGQCQKY